MHFMSEMVALVESFIPDTIGLVRSADVNKSQLTGSESNILQKTEHSTVIENINIRSLIKSRQISPPSRDHHHPEQTSS